MSGDLGKILTEIKNNHSALMKKLNKIEEDIEFLKMEVQQLK